MLGELMAPAGWANEAIQIELIGCGGTGSAMADELFRMSTLLKKLGHPGLKVRIWDGDNVSEANVGRQRFWPADVGWNKAELIVSRYNGFGEAGWKFVDRHVTPADLKRLNTNLLISCVDSAKTRVAIARSAGRLNNLETLWLDTGNDDHSGQVILGHWCGIAKKPDGIPNVYDLYPSLAGQNSTQRPSCSTEEALKRQDFGINQRIAGEASGLLWRLVRYGKVDRHGSFVYQDIGEVMPLAINPTIWKSFDRCTAGS